MPEDEVMSSSRTEPRSNRGETRHRSRSPHRDRETPRRKEKGFKWKEKRQDGDGDILRDGEKRLERGYKEHYRARSPQRGQEPNIRLEGAKTDDPAVPKENNARKEKKEKKDRKEKKPAAIPVSEEPMIIVNVNDRLGTKAAIPCFASDPIKLFKAQVAARIGREPHEILLKRQGERPFKDQLTLEDYGVSNGVQLDLEVDTGD